MSHDVRSTASSLRGESLTHAQICLFISQLTRTLVSAEVINSSFFFQFIIYIKE